MRIQILPLPEVQLGEQRQTPFALVFDRVESALLPDDSLKLFADRVGAVGSLVVQGEDVELGTEG